MSQEFQVLESREHKSCTRSRERSVRGELDHWR